MAGSLEETVPWEEVDYATADHSDNSVEVVSKSGVIVKHTKYHVDDETFSQKSETDANSWNPGAGWG